MSASIIASSSLISLIFREEAPFGIFGGEVNRTVMAESYHFSLPGKSSE